MNKNCQKEIEKWFAVKSGDGAYKLDTVDSHYPAWVLHYGNEYGVFVLYDGGPVCETFSGSILCSNTLDIKKIGSRSVLQLTSRDNELRQEFAVICESFVDPGENGQNREKLLDDPVNWWKNWTQLLGDSSSNKMIYDIVGELWAVLKLFHIGKRPFWSAVRQGTHDIEVEDESYEVKTTTSKTGSLIHVNSKFQFHSDKPVYLVFTRLELSELGQSIDDLLKEIEIYDSKSISKYNDYLFSKGYGEGSHLRKIKYVLLERNLYIIDEKFPLLTKENFKGDTFPPRIVNYEYTLSLDGLSFTNWE